MIEETNKNRSNFRPSMLRRTNAGDWNFTAPGNTHHSLQEIDNFLDVSEYPNLCELFYKIFDNVCKIDPSVSRSDSFTHEWLTSPKLLAIIAYLDSSFLEAFTAISNATPKSTKFPGNLYIHQETFNFLMGKYDGLDDQDTRISVAREFLRNGIEYEETNDIYYKN